MIIRTSAPSTLVLRINTHNSSSITIRQPRDRRLRRNQPTKAGEADRIAEHATIKSRTTGRLHNTEAAVARLGIRRLEGEEAAAVRRRRPGIVAASSHSNRTGEEEDPATTILHRHHNTITNRRDKDQRMLLPRPASTSRLRRAATSTGMASNTEPITTNTLHPTPRNSPCNQRFHRRR